MSLRNNENNESVIEEKRLTLFEHLEELRSRLIKSLIAAVIGTIIAFIFSAKLIDYLLRPCIKVITITYYNSILTPFNIRFKASMYAGVVLASPVLLYQIWKFVQPALSSKERKVVRNLFGFALFSFFVGEVFGYFVLIPLATRALVSYQTELMKPLIGIEETITFVVFFLLAVGAIFEIPLVMMGLAKVGIVKSRMLRRNWRIAVFASIFVGFCFTPEIITGVFLAIPIFLLYELSIILVKFVEKKKDLDSEESDMEEFNS